jgi:hypothetical protein
MTKGRAVLPGRVVAEQEPFFITLGGPLAHDSSGRDDNFVVPVRGLARNTRPSNRFVIPRVCNFIGFAEKPMLKTKALGALKIAKKSIKSQAPTGADPDFLRRFASNGHMCGSL